MQSNTDPLLLAKLAKLAAQAELTRIKAQQNKHYDRELEQECCQIASLARECAQQAANLHK